MSRTETAPVLPGETLAGKYRIERVLGKGGMGIVVAARHLELEERVAIKFLLRKDDPVALERFVREARAAAKVKSEHVCRVFDVGRLESGEPYLVMEYLEGFDLAALLARDGRLGAARAASLVIEACAAIGEAHAIGIIHRDLKPANLFVSSRGDGSTCLKVLDFGISKLPNVDAMTSTTVTMGSPAYMSPEQVVSARDVDARADVWSLGVILYELVSGTLPFVAESIIQLSVKIREATPPPLSSLGLDLPPGFEEVVGKAMEKDPSARHPDAGALALSLAPFADASAAQLALRVRSIPPRAGDPAFAGTLDVSSGEEVAPLVAVAERPNARSVEVPSTRPSAPDETLEPLSRADDSRAHRGPRSGRWLPLGAVLAGVAGLGVASRFCGGESASVPHAPLQTGIAMPDVAVVTEPASISAQDASEVDGSMMAKGYGPKALTSASTHPPTPAPQRAMPSQVRANGADASSPLAATDAASLSSTPAAAAPADAADAGRRKRSLDRTDPYEH